MDRDGVKDFLRELMGDPNLPLKDQRQWVMCSCPLAFWLHKKGKDSNYSFGVKVEDGDVSVFNCWGCKKKGPLEHLVELYENYSGETLDELKQHVGSGEFLSAKLPEWGKRKTKGAADRLGDPLGVEFEDLYDPAAGHWYLRHRGIPDEVAEELGLGIDPRDVHGDSRIVFPVRDPDGRLYGYTGRAFNDNPYLRVKDYFGLKKSCLLLGAEWISPERSKYVILVEGLFDFARLFGFGFPVVAAMHAGITEQQAAILRNFGLPVYAFQDRDEGGEAGKKVIKKLLGKYLPVMKVRYPDREVQRENGEWELVGDPGELFEEEVEEMVRTARLL